jgi:hypothetical protein
VGTHPPTHPPTHTKVDNDETLDGGVTKNGGCASCSGERFLCGGSHLSKFLAEFVCGLEGSYETNIDNGDEPACTKIKIREYARTREGCPTEVACSGPKKRRLIKHSPDAPSDTCTGISLAEEPESAFPKHAPMFCCCSFSSVCCRSNLPVLPSLYGLWFYKTAIFFRQILKKKS